MAPDNKNDASFWPGHRLLIPLAIVVGASAWLWWLCDRDPHIKFLVGEGPAEWIVYPVPANVIAQVRGTRITTFRRTFSLEQKPNQATLRLRALGRPTCSINNRPVSLPASPNWKQTVAADVAMDLRAGTNEILVAVGNDTGPPALWLNLAWPGGQVMSDGDWQTTIAGSLAEPARLAVEPMPVRPGNPIAQTERTADSIRSQAPVLGLFALVALGAVITGSVLGLPQRLLSSPRGRCLFLAGLTLVWLVLLVHNAPLLRFPIGFDARAHLDYVRHIQKEKALPLANEGWEAHQPPLFYLLSTLVLGLSDISADAPSAITALRALNFIASLIQLALIAAALRLLVPDSPGAQLIGTFLVACLPMQLYMSHYLTNDVLAGAFASAAVYLTLRLLRSPQPTVGLLMALGACIGTALLTKVTTTVIVPVILFAIAGRLMAQREWRPRAWLRQIGIPLLVCVLVSGWHFGRVWHRFGTPFIGSYDPASGFQWWQDPGYNTTSYFLRFGRSLREPSFSEMNGFADGLYSTMWGDALWGGVAEKRARTPWNYELMAASMVLALAPSLLLVIGFCASVVELFRRRTAEWLLVVGLMVFMGLGLLYHFLRLPYACHVKAFYALPAVLGLAALAALGFQTIAKRFPVMGSFVAFAIVMWGLAAFATHWVSGNSAQVETWTAGQAAGLVPPQNLAEHYQNALAVDPKNEFALLGLGSVLAHSTSSPASGLEWIRKDVQLRPDSFLGHYMLGSTLEEQGDIDQAIPHAREAIRLGPDYYPAYSLLGMLLAQRGRTEDAIEVYRKGIGRCPADAQLHFFLAQSLEKIGQIHDAIDHYRMALQWHATPAVMQALGWVLASHAEASGHNTAEALRLANAAWVIGRASRQIDPVNKIKILDTLGAASANAGRFSEALRAAGEALRLAQQMAASVPSGKRSQLDELIGQIKARIALYEKGMPYREGRAP
jgi:tetratricopeptide (TPR) repeat protein